MSGRSKQNSDFGLGGFAPCYPFHACMNDGKNYPDLKKDFFFLAFKFIFNPFIIKVTTDTPLVCYQFM